MVLEQLIRRASAFEGCSMSVDDPRYRERYKKMCVFGWDDLDSLMPGYMPVVTPDHVHQTEIYIMNQVVQEVGFPIFGMLPLRETTPGYHISLSGCSSVSGSERQSLFREAFDATKRLKARPGTAGLELKSTLTPDQFLQLDRAPAFSSWKVRVQMPRNAQEDSRLHLLTEGRRLYVFVNDWHAGDLQGIIDTVRPQRAKVLMAKSDLKSMIDSETNPHAYVRLFLLWKLRKSLQYLPYLSARTVDFPVTMLNELERALDKPLLKNTYDHVWMKPSEEPIATFYPLTGETTVSNMQEVERTHIESFEKKYIWFPRTRQLHDLQALVQNYKGKGTVQPVLRISCDASKARRVEIPDGLSITYFSLKEHAPATTRNCINLFQGRSKSDDDKCPDEHLRYYISASITAPTLLPVQETVLNTLGIKV